MESLNDRIAPLVRELQIEIDASYSGWHWHLAKTSVNGVYALYVDGGSVGFSQSIATISGVDT